MAAHRSVRQQPARTLAQVKKSPDPADIVE
jgi:hypothetical protein